MTTNFSSPPSSELLLLVGGGTFSNTLHINSNTLSHHQDNNNTTTTTATTTILEASTTIGTPISNSPLNLLLDKKDESNSSSRGNNNNNNNTIVSSSSDNLQHNVDSSNDVAVIVKDINNTNNQNNNNNSRDSVCSNTQEATPTTIGCEDEEISESCGNATTSLSTSLVSANSSISNNARHSLLLSSSANSDHHFQSSSPEKSLINNDHEITPTPQVVTTTTTINNNKTTTTNNNNEQQQQPIPLSRLSIGDILKGLKATTPTNQPPQHNNFPITPQSARNYSTASSSGGGAIHQVTSPKKKNSDPILPRGGQHDSKLSFKRKKKNSLGATSSSTTTTIDENNSINNISTTTTPSESTSLINHHHSAAADNIDQSPHKRKLSLSVTIQNKISHWRSKNKKNTNTSSISSSNATSSIIGEQTTVSAAITSPTSLLLMENNHQYSHLLSEKSQSADTFNTSISSINSFVSNTSTSEIDFKCPILKISEENPDTPRKSSNPQIQSLKNILTTNRQRFYSSANDLSSQISDVSPMVCSPPASPFSENQRSPKVSLLNFSQIVPSLIEGPKISSHRGEKKSIFDYITTTQQQQQDREEEHSPKRKMSLPVKPEFLNSPKHNKKQQESTSRINLDCFVELSPPTPTIFIPITTTTTTPRHNSPKEETEVTKKKKKIEELMCADTLLIICSFIKGGSQFWVLRSVCQTWNSLLDDEVLWRAMYLNYLDNLIKNYWNVVGDYYGSTEKHPKSSSNNSSFQQQPKKPKEEISFKYRLLNKRHKFLKALQKELTIAKPNTSVQLSSSSVDPTTSGEIIHIRRGTIANFKQFENLETRRRTSSTTTTVEKLTSPRFDDLSNFVGFGFQNPTSPPSSICTPNNNNNSLLMSPRKHAHSTASLFDMKKQPNVKKSKRPTKQEQVVVEELSSKQIYLELVKDETRSRIQIGLKILQPVQLVKCLVDKEYSVSRMTFFFYPALYHPVSKFLSTCKNIILGKFEEVEKDQFMNQIFQHLSIQFFSLFLLGLKSLKTNLISNPVDFPEFYGELRKIMPTENTKCSNSVEAQFLADKLITKYFTMVVDRLNPEISFEVLSLFMDSFARIGKNKLLILVLEKAKEKFYDYETQITPRLTRMVAHGAGKVKHKSAENDFLHLMIEKIIPLAAMEQGDYQHIVDMLFDIMQTHYGIDNKQIALHFKKLTCATTTQSIIDPHISIVKACFQNGGSDNVSISFFDYLIDKFSIDMNRKEILFFLLENHENISPYMEHLKKTNKMDPKFVSRCFHSKHFAEFLVTQMNARTILERLFTFFSSIDPLADFENENSFKSIEEAWKLSSSGSSGSGSKSGGGIGSGIGRRNSSSLKNKDNFLKIISKIEIRNNEPKPVYNIDVLDVYKLLCTRFKEQEKKFNLQKIDRDLNIGVNLITHVFVREFSVDNFESLYEMCDLLINHSNVLIDCKILKLILMKSEMIEHQYEKTWTLLNILNNNSKALELILSNSAMIIPKNPNSSMKSSMHGSDIIGYSEWYLNYKLTNDPSPMVEEYIQLFERTQAFIERNRIYGDSSNFGCFSCCSVQ